MNTRFVAAVALALSASAAALGTPHPARADANAPAAAATPYPVPPLPAGVNVNQTVRTILNSIAPYAGQYLGNRLNSNVGTVTYFKRFDMQINVGGNRYTNVKLHQGTTIDPRGESIRLGDTVDVGGVRQQDGTLDANAITIRH